VEGTPADEEAGGPRAERDVDAPEAQAPSSLGQAIVGAASTRLEAGQLEQLLALRSLLAAGIERIDAMQD
jgi:hypothetical protein